MNILERFIVWLTTKKPPPMPPLLAYMNLARQAQYNEDYPAALEYLAEAEKMATEQNNVTAGVDIVLSRADVYTYQQRFADAEKLIIELRQRAEATNQRAPLAYALCSSGVLAQAQARYDDARQMFERALKIARTVRAIGAEARANAHLADIYLHENNASYALHLLKDALVGLETSGDVELLPYFMLRMGEAHFISGNPPEGERLLQKALERAQQMGHVRYERLAYLAMGARALTMQHYAQARQYDEVALKLFPAWQRTGSDYVQAVCHYGRVLLQQGDTALALEQARLALQHAEPALIIQAQALLGMALSAHGEYAAALEPLQAAVTHYHQQDADTHYLELLRHLAQAQAAVGELDTAAATYAQAIQVAQTQQFTHALADTYADYGRLFEQRHQYKEALAQFSEALKLYEAENHYGNIALLYCAVAQVCERMGQGKRAIRDYEQALLRLNYLYDDPTRGAVQHKVALAYMDYGDMDSAESFLQQAIEHAHKSGDKLAEATYRTDYGRFLTLVGDVRPAIATLMEARIFSVTHELPLLTAIQADSLATAYRMLHDAEQTNYHHEEALKIIRTLPQPEWQAIFELNLAHTHWLRQDYRTAETLLNSVLTIGRSLTHIVITARALVGQAECALLQGQTAQIAEKLNEALSLAQQSYSKRLLAEVRLTQSHYATLEGETTKATELWHEAEKLMKILRMPFSRPEWISL